MASTMARARWARPVPTAEAEDGPPGVGVPVGAAEPGEGRHHHDPLAGVDRPGQRLEVAERVDDAEAVPQPLHAGAGDEHRALQGVGHGPAGRGPRRGPPPSVPRSQARVVSSPSAGGGHPGPAFIRTKLPVPKVTLVIPRVKQAWPKRAACWSPAIPLMGHPGQRGVATRGRAGDGAEAAARGPHLGEGPGGHAEEVAELVRPRPPMMSKSRVREALVASVARTPPSTPPVRFQSTQESTVPRARSGAGRAPLPRRGASCILVAREVGVEDQAGASPDQGEVAGLDQVVADRRRSGGPARRWPGGAGDRSPVPGHHGLALVGDADGRGHPAGSASRPATSSSVSRTSVPDLVGVVLDPAGPGEVLGELAVGQVDTRPASSTTRARTPVVPASTAMDHGRRRRARGTVATPRGARVRCSRQQSCAILRERLSTGIHCPISTPIKNG